MWMGGRCECLIWDSVCSKDLSDTQEGVSYKPLGILVCLVKKKSDFGERCVNLQHLCVVFKATELGDSSRGGQNRVRPDVSSCCTANCP